MRIIALCGSANVGKTTTLKELIRECKARGATPIAGLSSTISPADDIEVFDYKGKVVCVSTGGDTVDVIDEGYDVAAKHLCEVFVTAARGRWNCSTLGRVCQLAGSGAYPILLSAYWEQPSIQLLALQARVDALLCCL